MQNPVHCYSLKMSPVKSSLCCFLLQVLPVSCFLFCQLFKWPESRKVPSNTVTGLQAGAPCPEADVLLLLMPGLQRTWQGIRLAVGFADGALHAVAVTCRTPCSLLLQQLFSAAPLPAMCSLTVH